MKDSVKLKNHSSAEAVLGDGSAKKRRAAKIASGRASFAGKKFSELTPEEKDGLLQALAIRAGLIEE